MFVNVIVHISACSSSAIRLQKKSRTGCILFCTELYWNVVKCTRTHWNAPKTHWNAHVPI
ncbi:unnamed protein product [Staurois parvus]|uniref:Uncharacterized protein n=1 Tax=Staurois parvus TaxID=386267 RepID=A0ABN9EX83_9NEOB|nr:unnamed protein product [Staurois parvus]